MAHQGSVVRIAPSRRLYTAIPDEKNRTNRKNKQHGNSGTKLSICICDSGDQTIVLLQAVRSLQWATVNVDKQWDVYWTLRFPEPAFCRRMKRYQCVNHFSGMHEICRKDLLAKNLLAMQKLAPEQYDFFPPSWVFPYDYNLAIDYARSHPNTIYILKPVRGSMGRGIEMTRTLRDSMRYDRIVCQVYMKEPLLLDRFKFDLRVYVLVASVEPLRIYVYNEGLVRLATRHYAYPNRTNIRDKYMHLTNYSINKHSATYSRDWETGSKRRFESFNKLFVEEGYDIQKLWNDIDDVIVKTILTALPELQHEYRTLFHGHDRISACFEILGFDIIIDHDLRPFLLEVNQSPSFNNNTHIDDTVKTNLIHDTLKLLNLSTKYRQHVIIDERKRLFGGDGKIRQRTNEMPLNEQTADIGQFRELDLTNYSELMAKANVSSYYSETKISHKRAEYGQQKRQALMTANNNEHNATSPKEQPNTPQKIRCPRKSTIPNDDNNFSATAICDRDEMQRLKDLNKRDKCWHC